MANFWYLDTKPEVEDWCVQYMPCLNLQPLACPETLLQPGRCHSQTPTQPKPFPSHLLPVTVRSIQENTVSPRNNSRSSPTFQICPPKQFQCGIPGLQGLTFHQQDKNYMAFHDSASEVPQHALLAETLTTYIQRLGWGENAVFSYVLKPPQIFLIRTGEACKRISAGEKYDLICILRSF